MIRSSTSFRFLGLCAALGSITAVAAQERPIALTNARILTLGDAGTIERGTVVMRDGKIVELGADVAIPAGAEVVDVQGGTVMPGLVHAWSQAGVETRQGPQQGARGGDRGRGRRQRIQRGGGSRSNASNAAATKVANSVYARQEVFGELLERGVTTLIVRPEGDGLPGQAARLDPSAEDHDAIVLDDDTYVVVQPAANAATKKVLKEAFEAASKVVEARKKPPQPEKPAETPAQPEAGAEKAEGAGDAEGGEQPPRGEPGEQGEKPKAGEAPAGEAAKPEAKQPEEPKKDPNAEVLADLLEGKRRAFVRAGTAMQLVHYLEGIGAHRFPLTLVSDQAGGGQGRLDQVVDKVRELGGIVLIEPRLETLPYTQILVNPAARLHAAGVEIGFVLPDRANQVEDLFFALMELVRHGLPADVALRAVTVVPAKALGLDSEVGSLAKGKRADLLVFSGAPLDPASRLTSVYLAGRPVDGGLQR